MAALNVAQGRLGWIKITPTGGTALILPAAQIQASSPRNLMAPVPVGRSYQTVHAEGFQTTSISAQIFIMDHTITGANSALGIGTWSAPKFLDLFFTRDVTSQLPTCEIVFDNGAKLMTCAGCMAQSISLRVGKGDTLAWNVQFFAPAPPTVAAHQTAPAYAPAAPLTFAHLTSVGLLQNIYGVEFSQNNGLLVDAPVTITTANVGVGANAWDAGVITAGATFTLKDTIPTSLFNTGTDTNAIALTVTGATSTARTFTLTNVVATDLKSGNANLGQSFKEVPCLVEGTDTVLPIVVS